MRSLNILTCFEERAFFAFKTSFSSITLMLVKLFYERTATPTIYTLKRYVDLFCLNTWIFCLKKHQKMYIMSENLENWRGKHYCTKVFLNCIRFFFSLLVKFSLSYPMKSKHFWHKHWLTNEYNYIIFYWTVYFPKKVSRQW